MTTGDELRRVAFLGGPGYLQGQVDELLVRCAAMLDAGESPAALLEGAGFGAGTLLVGRGYSTDAVDAFLAELTRAVRGERPLALTGSPWVGAPVANYFLLPPGRSARGDGAGSVSRRSSDNDVRTYFDEECKALWNGFVEAGGRPMVFRSRRSSFVLTDWMDRPVATGQQSRPRGIVSPTSNQVRALAVDGHHYVLRKRSVPRQAEGPEQELLALLGARGTGHKRGRHSNAKGWWDRDLVRSLVPKTVRELVDEQTQVPVLRLTGHNHERRSCAEMMLGEDRWLRFPVRGRNPARAIMTAVDQSGTRVARYRLSPSERGTVEIRVNAEENLGGPLLSALAVGAPFLKSFYEMGGGG